MALPIYHTSYRVMNKPLKIWGCDREMFMNGLYIAVMVFVLFSSVPAAVVAFMILLIAGRIRAKDPVKAQLSLQAGRYKAVYDAAVKAPYAVTIHD